MTETNEIDFKSTLIGAIDVDAGHDQYLLLNRVDGEPLTPEDAAAWLHPRTYRDTGVPGGYYCHTVRAVQADNNPYTCICTIEHRFDI